MTAMTDEHIRVRAYHLWEADGRPDGRDQEFWQRAEQSLTTADNGGPKPAPRRRSRAKPAAAPQAKRRKS